MLFRNDNDKLVEIKKHDFVSDKEYYKAIIKIKKNLYKRNQILNMFNTHGHDNTTKINTSH